MNNASAKETDLTSWIGRNESRTDVIDLRQAHLMQATMGQSASLQEDDVLPPLWHWIYFLEGKPFDELGSDGHPKLGGFMPPVPLPRRMWAGSEVIFHQPICLGDRLTKTSTIENIVEKDGKSGALCFVTVRHELAGSDNEAKLTDRHTIVYREPPVRDVAQPMPQTSDEPNKPAKTGKRITPSTVTLFRYSALTFNGHRIHYDREYCRDVEGYPDLVFHGPLTATLLAAEAQLAAGDRSMKEFSFRALSPLFDTHPFYVSCEQVPNTRGTFSAIAVNHLGEEAMKASATFDR